MIDNHLYEGQQGGGDSSGSGRSGTSGGSGAFGGFGISGEGCVFALFLILMWALLTLALIFAAFIVWCLIIALFGFSSDSAGIIWYIIGIGSAIASAVILFLKLAR